MMETPIKLLIPFEALVEAIILLDKDDQLRLRRILDRHLRQTEENLDDFLAQRGCQKPLKDGLALTTEPANSGQSNIASDHDRVILQQFEAER